MVAEAKPVGEKRYRESYGRYLEDFNVGDIYLGSVRKVVQGLNATFIDIGYEKDAFLHYLDLGPNFSSLNKFTRSVLARKNVNYRLNSHYVMTVTCK